MSTRPRAAACALLLALSFALLPACSPQAKLPTLDPGAVSEETKAQKMLVIRDRVEKMDRLNRVGWRVRATNVELCGERVVYGVGLTFQQLDDYDKEGRDLIRETVGIESRTTVFHSVPGSPGHEAGLRRGDIVLSVDNVKVERKKEAYAAIKDAIEKGRDIPMEYERAGERRSVVLQAAPLCGYPVVFDSSEVLNAYADGNRIIITMGMMKFVRTDDELAGVLGHELAHNTRKHIRDKTVNAVLGRLLLDLPIAMATGLNTNLGGQLGAVAFSQDYEFEADYVGLYHSARAGYDMAAVAEFWRRMALEDPKSITNKYSTHPTSSARFVRLDATAAEIEAKRKAGRPLAPELKDAPAPKPAAAQKADMPLSLAKGGDGSGAEPQEGASVPARQGGPAVQADSLE